MSKSDVVQSKTQQKLEKKRKKQKKELIIGLVMVGIALFGTFGVFGIMRYTLNNDTPLVVVTSGSMEPVIYRGDLLVIENIPAEDIKSGTAEDKKGDIILYDSHGVWPDNLAISEPVVHRVVGKYYNETDMKYYFITKGDANPDTDPPGNPLESPVPENKVLGVVIEIIPKLGMVKIYLDESDLTVPLIILLGGLLVVSIIWDVTHPESEEEEEKKTKSSKGKKTKEPEPNVENLSETDKNSSKDPKSKVNLGV